MFNLLVASPLRQFSACETVGQAALQQIIMARTGPWLTALNAVPGVTATIEELRVACPRNFAVVRFRIDFRLQNVTGSGTILVVFALEPITFPSVTLPPASLPLCLRTTQVFRNLGELPPVIAQLLLNVVGMIFPERFCLQGAPPLRQSLR